MTAAELRFRIKRIYEPAENTDGIRVLVDRLWPRGLAREDARIDAWLKDIAPSPALRKWFGHDPRRWADFRRRYLEELAHNRDAVASLHDLAAGNAVTLLYGARDKVHNQARVLAEYLEHQTGADVAEAAK